MAHDLDCTESSRRLYEKIRTISAARLELAASFDQLMLMANGLDPLGRASWPKVDEVVEKRPHVNGW